MLDFTPWDEMLHQYVDQKGRVNYARWQAESSDKLNQWLSQVDQIDRQSDSADQLALWLNLYNALTIAQVLKRYPIASIQPKILGIPNWFAFLRFFTRSVLQLGGQQYSLNQIEHDVLRKTFKEPHIHFALVCASIGCPLLRNEAYLPETVQTQLEDDARRFINNPDKVKYDRATQTLYCSKIFKWYRQDFLTAAPSIPAYIQTYLTAELSLSDATTLRYLPYDWRLNQRTSS